MAIQSAQIWCDRPENKDEMCQIVAAKPRAIDETGVNLAMNRRYGRGEGGARVYDDRPGNRGKNTTLIGAMSDEGILAAMTFEGGLNTASFRVFIEQVLLPQLWIGAIVAMDNLPVHYAEIAKQLIEYCLLSSPY
jgi:hypothetical protein